MTTKNAAAVLEHIAPTITDLKLKRLTEQRDEARELAIQMTTLGDEMHGAILTALEMADGGAPSRAIAEHLEAALERLGLLQ